MSQWKTCGGCGADDPAKRCLGCFHYFGKGSWDTRSQKDKESDEWLEELEENEAYWLPHDHPEHPSNISKAKGEVK